MNRLTFPVRAADATSPNDDEGPIAGNTALERDVAVEGTLSTSPDGDVLMLIARPTRDMVASISRGIGAVRFC
jgi:hypothetical protein